MTLEQFKKIKLLVLDMDGVMTDGGIYLSADGQQSRKFNAKDGEGIKRLMRTGMKVAILTGSKEENIVNTRSQMLLISPDLVSMNTADKLQVLEEWSKKHGAHYDEMAYVGDDLPDIPVMEKVGISACPSDAVPEVLDVADIILKRKGGEGCVREFVDYFLKIYAS